MLASQTMSFKQARSNFKLDDQSIESESGAQHANWRQSPSLDVVAISLDVLVPRASGAVTDAYNATFKDAEIEWRWSVKLLNELLRSDVGNSASESYMLGKCISAATQDVDCFVNSLERRKSYFLKKLISSVHCSACPDALRLLRSVGNSDLHLVVASGYSLEDSHEILNHALSESERGMIDCVWSKQKGIRSRKEKNLTQQICCYASGTQNSITICAPEDCLGDFGDEMLPVLRIVNRSQRKDVPFSMKSNIGMRSNFSDYRVSMSDIISSKCRQIEVKEQAAATRVGIAGEHPLVGLEIMHRAICDLKPIQIPVNKFSCEGDGTMEVAGILKAKGTMVFTVSADQTIGKLAKLLRENAIGAAVVLDENGELAGIISERDISFGLAEHGSALLYKRVEQLMTRTVITCQPDDTIASLEHIMTKQRIRHIPVIDDGQIVGMVSIGDVLKTRLDELELEANVLRDIAIAAR